jgi:NAD(P)-dependent dehydrogenase (short-subunit alcohol dehydrogenase family)
VAVITGAARGIGRALTWRCAQEQMKIVLADLDGPALLTLETELRAAGTAVTAVTTDVSKPADVENLARQTVQLYQGAHVLFNNAGVGGSIRDLTRPIWEMSLQEWNWILGVNLWGVIHGVKFFLPIMLSQDTECHIINTASGAGLIYGPGLGAYKTSKHGVVSLTETLYFQLSSRGSQVKVSVVCPGAVKTDIMRPLKKHGGPSAIDLTVDDLSPNERQEYADFNDMLDRGMSPEQASEIIFGGVGEERLYIFTHPEIRGAIRTRMEDILQERNPMA